MICAHWSLTPPEPVHELIADLGRDESFIDAAVRIDHGLLRIDFPESEFSIRLRTTARATASLDITGIVREPAPSLQTWWATWSVLAPAGELNRVIVDEVTCHRRRFHRMLRENMRCEY
jgi:hypothetical protein